MIAAHRRRHRWIVALLALLLPLLLALALRARPPAPRNESLPAGAATFVEAESENAVPKNAVLESAAP